MADFDDAAVGNAFFVPVCLYPHTKYRTVDGILDLYRRFELHRCKHLIVVADSLLALDNLVTGRYWSYETVFLKARRDAKQVYNLIGKIASKQTRRDGKSK